MKQEMIQANELQKQFKAEARAREREEEMVLIQKMLDKFEQDERMERENARLQERLRKSEIIVQAQKKLAEVLSTLPTGEPSEKSG